MTHDENRPFVVRAGSAEAVDLGTTFVVRAYAGDSIVEVAVASGRVRLAKRGEPASPSIQLGVGDVGVITAGGGATSRHEGDLARFEAWTTGQLVFNDEPLSSVAAELGRWFDVDIRIPDQRLAAQRVNGVYTNSALTDVLDAPSLSFALRYERAGRTVTIAKRNP